MARFGRIATAMQQIAVVLGHLPHDRRIAPCERRVIPGRSPALLAHLMPTAVPTTYRYAVPPAPHCSDRH